MIAPVEFVEVDALEKVVCYAGECGCLVETAELNVSIDTRSDVEDICSDVGTRWLREERVVDDGCVEERTEHALG